MDDDVAAAMLRTLEADFGRTEGELHQACEGLRTHLILGAWDLADLHNIETLARSWQSHLFGAARRGGMTPEWMSRQRQMTYRFLTVLSVLKKATPA